MKRQGASPPRTIQAKEVYYTMGCRYILTTDHYDKKNSHICDQKLIRG